MANFDFKSTTPDTSFPSGGFIMGADSQAAATPSLFSDTAYLNHIRTLATTWSGQQTFVAPVLGAATATSINGLAITTSTGTLTIANGKTLTANNSLTLAGTDATTMTFPATSSTVAGLSIAQTFTAQNTFAAGTITSSAPTTITQTWNSGATTFTGFDINITDTASASASMLANMRVGGTTLFNVTKAGLLRPQLGLHGLSSNLTLATSDFASTGQIVLNASGMSQRVDGQYGFAAGNPGTNDVYIARDAANVLAQRNGTNAQTARVYTTYGGSGSDYERAAINTSLGAYVEFAAETAGTGGDNLDVRLTPVGTGGVNFPGGTLLKTRAALTNGAAAALGTLANAPAAGDPTKWIPINDNGTTRYIPAW